jgi:hypothetical protein
MESESERAIVILAEVGTGKRHRRMGVSVGKQLPKAGDNSFSPLLTRAFEASGRSCLHNSVVAQHNHIRKI